ncbi:NAD-dependent epimerase/dehydratase family protein [Streptomyces zingiberis]|uniref:NAD(P)-dependent oxidoreductase n=1 Tax=Streptomyces zingiberis TaxID=2053010 RepID=A0ABX1BYA3_9ACTN|nr:NAD(P)-dependent oxidoreductase [Streptomyces zingiberis]NJQ02656.1 NAD(P)-dependent oxidoreductase [Streptomyces zingiberis]
MRVLVLGAGGFLGGHAVESLRALPGARVLRGGRSPAGDLSLDLAATGVEPLAEALGALRPDAVVNCAGAVGGGAVRLAGLNARLPAVLCAALERAAPAARLVHLGSAGEYGPAEEGRSLAETDPATPTSLYAATKLAGTLAVSGAPLDAVVLRVFNPVGPGAPEGGLPGRLAAELRRAGPGGTVVVGDLSAHRDFVDARDVARAVTAAVTAPAPLPRILNIGGGEARPVRAVADGLVRAAGFRGRLTERGLGPERSAAVSWQRADIRSAATALGWRPEYGLDTSLRDLWAAGAAGAALPAGHGPR